MKKLIIIFFTMSTLLFSCAELDVVNENAPDTDRVLSTPDDLKGLVAGSFSSLYRAFIGWNTADGFYANVHLEWTADHVTMTNNFRAFWSQFKVEPRPALNNTLSFGDIDLYGEPYRVWFAAVANANDVINKIENEGVEIGTDGSETQMVLAAAHFARGMAYGYLANLFVEAAIVEPGQDLTANPPQLVGYQTVIDESLKSLDRVIEISNANTFTLDPSFINTPAPYTSTQMSKLASTFAANFLVQNARTAAENTATNWTRVLNYTTNGMTEDYVIVLDGVNWDHGLIGGAGLDWYWRVDHRIIRLMDPAYPKRFTTDVAVNSIPAAVSDDERLDLYFKYETGLNFFNTSRGAQLRSHYRVKRYDDLFNNNSLGPCPFMYAEANKLLRAEALARTNNVDGAINILNTARRVTVGELSPIALGTSQAQVLETIFAERDLELLWTDYGIHFKDMRRRDALQIGTILHFPVPANVLAVLQLPFYTFGGVSNADGVNTASGSNSWLNN